MSTSEWRPRRETTKAIGIRTTRTQKTITHDVIYYYEYLTAAFMFNDMSFQFAYELPDDFESGSGNIPKNILMRSLIKKERSLGIAKGKRKYDLPLDKDRAAARA